eukprot:1858237-Prymnesium_polylepis.1
MPFFLLPEYESRAAAAPRHAPPGPAATPWHGTQNTAARRVLLVAAARGHGASARGDAVHAAAAHGFARWRLVVSQGW